MPKTTALVLAPLLAAALVAQEPAVELTRKVYPIGPVTSHGDEVWQTYRAIDGLTGEPIAGAELLLIDEANAPIRGEFWFAHRVAGDADGFVRIRTDDRVEDWHWLLLRAPGYGAAMEMGSFDGALVPLARAQDLPVRVLDWQGRPVSGVLVGYCCGCGHTPDLAHATSGADGIAVLGGIDLHNGIRDLYVEHQALHLGYRSVTWFPGDPPAPFRPRRGVPMRGTVLGVDGEPAAGLAVGVPDVHRGPWTRTAADGSFGLFGLDRRQSDLFVVLGERRVLFELPDEQPYRLQLPEPNDEDTQVVEIERPPAPEVPAGDELLTVALTFESARPLRHLEYTLTGSHPQSEVIYGESDGTSFEQLLPGRFELRVTCDDHRQLARTVDVAAGADNAIRVRLEPLPATVVRVDHLAEDASVTLLTHDGSRDITDYVDSGRPVGIDDRGPVWIALASGRDRRVLPFAAGAATASPVLELSGFEPTVVRGRLVDERGGFVAARVAIVPVGWEVRGFDIRELEELVSTDGELELPATSVGLTLLAVLPVDDALAPRLLSLSLPERGFGRRLDLGDVKLSRTPRLTVHDTTSARFIREGWSDLRDRGPDFPVVGDRWLGPDPRAGDAIIIPGTTARDSGELLVRELPHRQVLLGDGPWTVRPPTGELLVDVRSTDGDAIRAVVLFDDQEIQVGQRTLLRGVTPGPKTVYVSADGRLTAIARLEVLRTGRSALELELPRR